MTTSAPTTSPPRPARRTGRRWPPRRVGGVLAGGFLVVSSFQVALAAGAPFGAAAYGGGSAGQLPPDLRVASTVAAGFWLLAAGHALARGGWAARWAAHLPWAADRRITWALAVLCAGGALLNLASSSPWERFGWAPATLLLALLCRSLARSGG